MTAEVSTDVEWQMCWARSQGWGLTKEVARRRSAAEAVRTVPGFAWRYAYGYARVRER
jgi:hypothetical protein